MKIKLLAQVLLVIILASCSAPQTEGTQSPGSTMPSQTSDPLSTPISAQPTQQGDATQMNPLPPASGMEALVEKAKEDLSQRLTVPTSEISLVSAAEVI